MLNPTTLTEAVQRIGRAFVYTGDPFTPGGLVSLGSAEGDIQADEQFEFNDVKTPEWTGDSSHSSYVSGQKAIVTLPLILKGDGSQLAKLSPTGQRGGGFGKQKAVVPVGVLIIPEDEVSTGLSWSGSAWVPAAPKLAIWIWRAKIIPGPIIYKQTDGGKTTREVTIETMFDDARPDGYKLYMVGDPRTVGISVNP